MKKGRRLLAMVLIGALVLSTFSGTSAEAKKKQKPKFNKTKITMKVGDEKVLKIKNNKAGKSVKWRSSNKKVVDFDNTSELDCLLNAYRAGSATITAKIGKVKLKCKVKVKKNKNTSSSSSNSNTKTIIRSLTASDTNVVVKEGESVDVQIKAVFTETCTLMREISNDCCTTKWGGWTYRTTSLTITGDKAGQSTVRVYCKEHPEVSTTINVTVVSKISVQLPSTPLILSDEGYRDIQKYNLSNIYYTATRNSDGNYTIRISFSGSKSYDSRDSKGTRQSSSLHISWKLCRGNVVVDSGTTYTPSLLAGEAFENEGDSIYNVPPGEYELQILNTNAG